MLEPKYIIITRYFSLYEPCEIVSKKKGTNISICSGKQRVSIGLPNDKVPTPLTPSLKATGTCL